MKDPGESPKRDKWIWPPANHWITLWFGWLLAMVIALIFFCFYKDEALDWQW